MSKARDLANAGTALTTVSATELGYLDGVTSAVQTQIDSKIGQSTAINPTIVDAKGDIIAATGADAVSRLAVGANGTVLTAASGEATGLQWATPSSGGITLLSTTSLSGSSVSVNIASGYKDIIIRIQDVTNTVSNTNYRLRFNNNSSASTYQYGDIAGTSMQSRDTSLYLSGPSRLDPDSNLYFHIRDYTDTDVFKYFTFQRNYNGSVTGWQTGAFYSKTAISSVQFYLDANAFSSGSIKIWGIK